MGERGRSGILYSRLLSRYPELVHGIAIGKKGPLTFQHGTVRAVVRTRERFFKHLGIRGRDVVLGEQVHGRRVRAVSRKHTGAGSHPGSYLHASDGLVTAEAGIVVGVYAADCISLFVYDPIRRVVGIAHAGWRGILRGIVPAFIDRLNKAEAKTQQLRVWFGPSVHSCCYDVTDKHDRRVERFQRRYGRNIVEHHNNRTYLNLQRAAYRDFLRAGVPPSSIEIDPTCTVHDHRRLPSAIREQSKRRNVLLGVIGLRDPLDNLKGKRVLVLGLGIHGGGVSTARWLVHQGAHVTVTDIKRAKELQPSLDKLRGLPIDYVLGRHHSADVRDAELIVVNPGVPRDSPFLKLAQRLWKPIENDASIFFHFCPAPIIGITGTKGKTITSILTASMLRASRKSVVAVGHNQVPLLDALTTITPSSIVVMELSSWRLEGLKNRNYSPHIAVITNVMRDHLNRYRDLRAYAHAKELIARFQSPRDYAIVNRDDALTRAIGQRVQSQRWWFSARPFPEENGAYLKGDVAYIREYGEQHELFRIQSLFRVVRHEVADILAAALAARRAGASFTAIQHVIKTYRGVTHRLEYVGTVDGVQYINDSTATTPDAARAGLIATPGHVILIAGGVDKRLDYREFSKTILQKCTVVILFKGTATEKLLRHIVNMPVSFVSSMERAVRLAHLLAHPRDRVLLSPGAASFGLFKHEFDRGDQFRHAVKELAR